MMNDWCSSSQQNSAEDSDLLEPDEYREVIAATGTEMMNSVFDTSDDFYNTNENYDDALEDNKLFFPPPPPPASVDAADSTFFPNPFSQSTGPLPAREDYAGPYGFSVLLDGNPTAKNKWAYSKSLNKLYIVWNKIIPVQFKWSPNERNFVVRAVPVYTDAQDMKTPVLRCMLHGSAEDDTNNGFSYVSHIIRSENPGTMYEENPDSKRCSVLVPLGEPQPGTGTVTVTYKFMCKTTCVTGMMRRPITVLFTLERSGGEIVGRQKLNVKICSCPTRDMKKDEESVLEKQEPGGVKRSLSLMEKNVAQRLSKRNKTEHDDPSSLTIQFEDKEIFKHILEYNHGAVTSMLRRTPPDHPGFQALKDFLNTIEDKIDILSTPVSDYGRSDWIMRSLFHPNL